ncbi:hypothetical protein GCM10009601_22880 [Streptomyces thermospinosisporus]|uniref:Uncharacterized protein n=1 Tax=Streptomyces thermospinosisporus TaxID=161482 RepID=A0ABP4JLM8_9ACTN
MRLVIHYPPTPCRGSLGFDFADAWHGGSSLLVDGGLDAPVTVDLYTTRLPLTTGTVVEFIHRTDAGRVDAERAMAITDPAGPGESWPYTYPPVPAAVPVSGAGGWLRATIPLTGRSGSLCASSIPLTAAGPGALVARAVRRALPPCTASCRTAPAASSAAPAGTPGSPGASDPDGASDPHGSNCVRWGSCTPRRNPSP